MTETIICNKCNESWDEGEAGYSEALERMKSSEPGCLACEHEFEAAKSEHQDLPWHVTNDEIRTNSGLLIARMHTHLSINHVPQRENAELIVKAVNSFEKTGTAKVRDFDGMHYVMSKCDETIDPEIAYILISQPEKGTEDGFNLVLQHPITGNIIVAQSIDFDFNN